MNISSTLRWTILAMVAAGFVALGSVALFRLYRPVATADIAFGISDLPLAYFVAIIICLLLFAGFGGAILWTMLRKKKR